MTPVPTPLRVAMRLAQAASPALATRLLERLFFTPPRGATTAAARRFVRTGARFTLRVDGRRVVGWRWGTGPVVVLAHGWGGRTGRLAPLARALVDAGYAVVGYDAPGHGASGRGLSSLPEFARALCAIALRHGPVHAVVAHSMGGAATALAARWGLEARRFVFLAPPVDPGAWVIPLSAALGVGDEVLVRMQERTERRLRFRWADLDVRTMARAMDRALLVVHDWDDDTVRWSDGAAIADAWPGARLFTTRGLGHRGVVRDPATIAVVTRFVAHRAGEPDAPSPADAVARLEYELFRPDARRR